PLPVDQDPVTGDSLFQDEILEPAEYVALDVRALIEASLARLCSLDLAWHVDQMHLGARIAGLHAVDFAPRLTWQPASCSSQRCHPSRPSASGWLRPSHTPRTTRRPLNLLRHLWQRTRARQMLHRAP